MKQPDLGKKISELRLAKGLTQGELAEKCNLSLRTIQRIESAEVTPRSYTVKLIFQHLDYKIYDSFGKFSYTLDRMAYRTRIWLGLIKKHIADLFNLKTNTMKKITILSIPCMMIILFFMFMGPDSNAQNEKKAKTRLTELNTRFVHLFNTGKIDSLGMLYLENACMMPDNYKEIHGRADITEYYTFLFESGFRFKENLSESALIISGPVAIDRGSWSAAGNIPLSGNYLTQWKYYDGDWYIENEMTNAVLPE